MPNYEESRQQAQDARVFQSAAHVLNHLMVMVPQVTRLMGVALPRNMTPIHQEPESKKAEVTLGAGIRVSVRPWSVEDDAFSGYFVWIEQDGKPAGGAQHVSNVTELAEVAIQLVWVILNERCPVPEHILALGSYTERLTLEPA